MSVGETIFYCLLWLFRFGSLLLAAALCGIVGVMWIGGGFSLLGSMIGNEWMAENAVSIGWVVGALFGIASSVRKIWKAFKSEKTPEDKDREKMQPFRRPTIKHFLGTVGLLMVIGAVLGCFVGVYLNVISISFLMSPFAPDEWRPVVTQNAAEPMQDAGVRHQNRGSGMSFQHPIILPVMLWSIGVTSVFGTMAGIFLSFVPDSVSVGMRGRNKRSNDADNDPE